MKQHFLITIIFMSGLIISCTNPFTTRADRVEKPSGTLNYVNSNTAEGVIENFRTALIDDNEDRYMRCMAPDGQSFTFVPEPHFFEEFNTRGWTQDDERFFYIELKDNVSSVSFEFPELISNPVDVPAFFLSYDNSLPDSMECDFASYKMDVVFNGDSSKVYRGEIRFKLYRDNELDSWHIKFIQDRAIDSKYDETLTSLKGSFFRTATL